MPEPTAATYTKRDTEFKEVASIEDGVIYWTDGWCFGGAPEGTLDQMRPGVRYVVETRNLSRVTGIGRALAMLSDVHPMFADSWLWRKTDAELDAEDRAFTNRLDARREADLDTHRPDWTRREAALPGPLRRRLERFRANGGHYFDRDGWGYELICSELAVLYAASGQQESAEIAEYDRREGCSGNQHDFAKTLSAYLTGGLGDEHKVVHMIAATTPFMGDPDYSKGSDE